TQSRVLASNWRIAQGPRFLAHAAYAYHHLGPLRIRRTARRRRRSAQRLSGVTYGLPVQSSPLLAASSIQLFPFSQLDRLLRSRSIDPSPGNSAPKQESALPHL